MMRLLQFRGFNKFIFPLALYVLILAGSSIPAPEIPRVFQLTPDKLIHFAEYFVLSFFLARVLITFFAHKTHVLGICCLAGLAAAGLDELYQHLIPGRTPDVRDWLVDAAGVVAGALTLLLVWKNPIPAKKN